MGVLLNWLRVRMAAPIEDGPFTEVKCSTCDAVDLIPERKLGLRQYQCDWCTSLW